MSLRMGKPFNFHNEWSRLENCLNAIFSMKAWEEISSCAFMSSVYRICVAKSTTVSHSEILYHTLRVFLEEHVSNIAKSLGQVDGPDFLTEYARHWMQFSFGATGSEHLFDYLEKHWIHDQIYPDPLRESSLMVEDPQLIDNTDICYFVPLAMRTWREKLFSIYAQRISEETLALIRQDRNGESIQPSLVSDIVSSMVQMNIDHKGTSEEEPSVYVEYLEKPYLEELRSYYAQESADYIEADGLWSYLQKALTRIDEEELRATRYLQPGSQKVATEVTCHVLVSAHCERIDEEFTALLEQNQTAHMHRSYLLLKRVNDGLNSITRQFTRYIKSYGMAHLEHLNSEDEERSGPDDAFIVAYIEALLEIYLKFSKLVTDIFQDHSKFVVSLEEAFRSVINENPLVKSDPRYSSAQMLAQYCDRILRKNGLVGKLEEVELERRLEHCTQLFKFVNDRDIFHHHYSVYLANRLIEDLSREEEHEQFVIRGLQLVAGMEYTSKLQRMFQDMKVAHSFASSFKEFCEDEGLTPAQDFSALVLTSGTWPLSRQCPEFIPPPSLHQCIQAFERFYDNLHSGRCLTWLHNCSKGDLYATFGEKTYQITMPTYLIAILLLFEQNDRLDYTEVQSATKLPHNELRKLLKTLVVSRLMLPDTKKLTQKTKFKINSRFHHKLLKFKLGGKIQMDKAKHSVSSTDISDGRKLMLQAVIVRIMKMRKELSHTQLVQEVLTQASAHFVPNVSQIKSVIETLIEKDFLERVEGENKYRYLA